MDGRKERSRRADAAGDREEVQPLIGEDTTEGAREGLDETHVLTPDSAGKAIHDGLSSWCQIPGTICATGG